MVDEGRLNPLHCGAVVASKCLAGPRRTLQEVLIPFIAGQWSLRAARRVPRPDAFVLIPFIAGQWSLPRAQIAAADEAERCLNPLHCGAVVASRGRRMAGVAGGRVLIPFIAGQWSLPEGGGVIRLHFRS